MPKRFFLKSADAIEQPRAEPFPDDSTQISREKFSKILAYLIKISSSEFFYCFVWVFLARHCFFFFFSNCLQFLR